MRLLLIEDDPRLVRSLAAGLAEQGFAVDVESDGPTGLTALLAHRYDACVLDVNLPTPACDGFAVVRAARAASCPVPILLLTARDALGDRIHGLDQGADDYLVKPFAFAELLARLRALFRRGTPQRSALLQLGALTLDPAARELRVGERRIEVTQKQLALLEYLLRHRGEIVTRSMILSGVWGYSFDPGTNLVNVHIAHLRRRIEESGHACPIETVRGVGFRIPSAEREAHDRSS
jgi:DNA-binding response OmpR family regulator